MTIPTDFNATADIYAADGTLARAGLPCRLYLLGQDSPLVRAEAPGRARFHYPPTYALSERASVEVEGRRWNVVAGTVATRPSGPSPTLGVADVVRAGSS